MYFVTFNWSKYCTTLPMEHLLGKWEILVIFSTWRHMFLFHGTLAPRAENGVLLTPPPAITSGSQESKTPSTITRCLLYPCSKNALFLRKIHSSALLDFAVEWQKVISDANYGSFLHHSLANYFFLIFYTTSNSALTIGKMAPIRLCYIFKFYQGRSKYFANRIF